MAIAAIAIHAKVEKKYTKLFFFLEKGMVKHRSFLTLELDISLCYITAIIVMVIIVITDFPW